MRDDATSAPMTRRLHWTAQEPPISCRCGWCAECIGDDLSVRPLSLRTPLPSEVRPHLEALGIPTDEDELLLRYCG